MSSLMQDQRLSAIRAQIPMLADTTCITVLGGGLTNMNYRIDTSSGTYVLRVSDTATGLLGIDRDHERINTTRANEAGAAPAVMYYLPHENALLIGWIDAKTLHASELQSQPQLLSRIANALRTLHAGPPFQGHFHFPTRRKKYLKAVFDGGYFIPDQYLEIEPLIRNLENILELNAEELVPCNNDLLAENFLDDGDKIWIIDYEYAGQNEASFDIGNLASEAFLTDEQLAHLCDAYWQQHIPSKIARAVAWSMIARFGWVMWASIQDAVSPIDFDFRTWGMKKWNSVLPELLGDRYEKVVAALSQTI